jgi:hypothetical protein
LGESVDQLTNRLLWLAGLLGVLLLGVIANYLLHGDEGGLNPVAQAAERTGHLPGGKVAMEISYTAPGLTTPIVGSGSGTFDTKSGRSQMEMSMPIPGRGKMTISAVGDTKTAYVRSPQFAGQLPPGKTWIGMQPMLGHDPETAFGTNNSAKGTLEMLSAVGGSVERVDRQTVRGHLTTRYKATIDFHRLGEVMAQGGEPELAREYEQLASQIPAPIPVEVWIDQQGIARRMTMHEELPAGDSGVVVAMDIRMELFDFGPQAKIDLPPKSEVLDITPMLRAELGMLDGSRYAKVVAPAGGPPLSAAAFHRKGEAICRDGLSAAKHVEDLAEKMKGELHQGADSEEGAAWLRRWAAELIGPTTKTFKSLGRRLASLSPPAADAAEYEAALQEIPVTLEKFEAIKVASEMGSTKALKLLDDEDGDSHEAEADARWRRLGLGTCAKDTDEEGQSGSAQSGASIE